MIAAAASLQEGRTPEGDREAFVSAMGARATPQALADLERFRTLVAERNAVMNLVGPATLPVFWTRHALDSAQLLGLAPDARVWADLGAGAGFPGVVLAIFLKPDPSAKVWLVDSLAKRCRFLEEVVAALDLPAEVVNARAESLALSVDVVTARACAPMDRLLGYALPCLDRGATGLFLKGRSADEELREARRSWAFRSESLPSITDPDSRIICVRSVSRVR